MRKCTSGGTKMAPEPPNSIMTVIARPRLSKNHSPTKFWQESCPAMTEPTLMSTPKHRTYCHGSLTSNAMAVAPTSMMAAPRHMANRVPFRAMIVPISGPGMPWHKTNTEKPALSKVALNPRSGSASIRGLAIVAVASTQPVEQR